MNCSSCKERQKKLEVAAKEKAYQNPSISREGESALKGIGLTKSRLIFIFIKAMSHILKIDAFRPATRNIEVAYYFIGDKLINDPDYRDMFYKTTVYLDEATRKTVINIDGKKFDQDTKFKKKRAKKCDSRRKIEELTTYSYVSSPEDMDLHINGPNGFLFDPNDPYFFNHFE